MLSNLKPNEMECFNPNNIIWKKAAEGINVDSNIDLDANILNLMSKFKRAYDDEDTEKLGYLISEDFNGNYNGAYKKRELIDLYKNYFKNLHFGVGIKLNINIFKIIESSHQKYRGIFDFKTELKLGYINTRQTIVSGLLGCEAIPDGFMDCWRISCIDTDYNRFLEGCIEVKLSYKKAFFEKQPDRVVGMSIAIQNIAKEMTIKVKDAYINITKWRKES